jgi:hypothetical protein
MIVKCLSRESIIPITTKTMIRSNRQRQEPNNNSEMPHFRFLTTKGTKNPFWTRSSYEKSSALSMEQFRRVSSCRNSAHLLLRRLLHHLRWYRQTNRRRRNLGISPNHQCHTGVHRQDRPRSGKRCGFHHP